VHPSIIEEQNAMLTMEISNLKVHAIVKALPTHKTTGHNGIPTEAFGLLGNGSS
jgi:hypothetical protein